METLPEIGLEPEMRINGPAAGLVSVSWVRVGPSGSMAVSQLLNYQLRLFDASGADLGGVGGPGPGPDEAQLLGGAGWIGDTLWVSDATLGRIALFSRQRELLRTLPPLAGALPKEGEEGRYPTFLSVFPMAVYPGDTLLVLAEGTIGDSPREPSTQGMHLLRISSDGRIQSHVLQVPEGGDRLQLRVDGRSFAALVPFSPIPLWTVSPDGDRVALLTTNITGPEGGSWRLQLFDAMGAELVSRSYPFQGTPIPGGGGGQHCGSPGQGRLGRPPPDRRREGDARQDSGRATPRWRGSESARTIGSGFCSGLW